MHKAYNGGSSPLALTVLPRGQHVSILLHYWRTALAGYSPGLLVLYKLLCQLVLAMIVVESWNLKQIVVLTVLQMGDIARHSLYCFFIFFIFFLNLKKKKNLLPTYIYANLMLSGMGPWNQHQLYCIVSTPEQNSAKLSMYGEMGIKMGEVFNFVWKNGGFMKLVISFAKK